MPDANEQKERHARSPTRDALYVLDEVRRKVVLESLQEVCRYRGWSLLAAHVRTNHVHVVVTSDLKPEPVTVAMKAYSSRALNRLGIDIAGQRRWARHGSTRYLWTAESVRAAIRYVVDEQGSPMAVWEAASYGELRSRDSLLWTPSPR